MKSKAKCKQANLNSCRDFAKYQKVGLSNLPLIPTESIGEFPPVSNRPTFRKRDLSVALDCIKKAGIEIKRIEIEAGKLVIIIGREEGGEETVNPWKGAEL